MQMVFLHDINPRNYQVSLLIVTREKDLGTPGAAAAQGMSAARFK